MIDTLTSFSITRDNNYSWINILKTKALYTWECSLLIFCIRTWTAEPISSSDDRAVDFIALRRRGSISCSVELVAISMSRTITVTMDLSPPPPLPLFFLNSIFSVSSPPKLTGRHKEARIQWINYKLPLMFSFDKRGISMS